MREVLISIQPKWVEKIVSGEKTVEVRRTRPKCETPFKCYIYCTQGKLKDLGIIGNEIYQKRMKVIGEFVCDKLYDLKILPKEYYGQPAGSYEQFICENSCLSFDDIKSYGNGKSLYGWHITDLVVYDEPKDLSQLLCRKQAEKCANRCEHNGMCQFCKEIRPPQSWCYCEKEDTK